VAGFSRTDVNKVGEAGFGPISREGKEGVHRPFDHSVNK
jgi:hypothetical protein